MLGAAAVGYALGSIPFALLLAARYGGRDPRTVGSRNPGAINVWRTTGATAGILVAVLDAGKGCGSVLLARSVSGEAAAVVAGVAAVVGHVWPVWFRFRGGKGVATACGAFAVLAPLACGVAVVVFAAVAWSTRYASAGSLAAVVTLPIVVWVTGATAPVMFASAATAAVIMVRHRQNLVRLVHGTEPKWGWTARVPPGAGS